MRRRALLAAMAIAGSAYGQQAPLDRLPADILDVTPPSARVSGMPGHMTVRPGTCRDLPIDETRERIVDVAIQEWGFFGFKIVDQTIAVEPTRPSDEPRQRPPRRPWLDASESARVADSIAGYWTVTPDGGWILSRQNSIWNGPMGVAARWRDPWSAAFISWVMCEGGLGEPELFQRAIAHHVYIDQAISARDKREPRTAFTAYDIGEQPVEPGDLLCSARRPAYQTIADRRDEAGAGARTHCDIVIKVDAANDRILTIGGNVRGSVSMKLMPAVAKSGSGEAAVFESIGRGRRGVFAHLKLAARAVGNEAFENSPTLQALGAEGQALEVLEQRIRGLSSTTAALAGGSGQRRVPGG